MPAPMPAIVALIVCKTVLLPADQQDQNAAWTGHEARKWAIEDSQMHCRRIEIQMYDQAAAMGADPQPFNEQRCLRSSLMLGIEWDMAHKSSPYRFYRVACPVPIVDTRTGEIISWKIPECGDGPGYGTMVCEVDSEI